MLWNKIEVNCDPLSTVMRSGVPKRVTQLARKARPTVSAVMSWRGVASGQRVHLSTQVKQYSNPRDGVRRPMMSTWTCENLSVGMVKCPKGAFVWRDTLQRWQGKQALAQAWTSLRMPGHT